MKKQQEEPKRQRPPGEGRLEGAEIYFAPPPPSKGRIIGLDCHPDTFTAAVFRGTTPHDARKLSSHPDMSLKKLLDWAAREFTRDDLFLLEAGSNSFEICRRLQGLGLRAVVMESCHVGKHARTYADNDKLAAARIALVYLQGNAPCVWQPDAITRERRELLHAYNKCVVDRTAATNSLKGYLNQFAVRPGNRSLETEAAEAWVMRQREWTVLQRELLAGYYENLRFQTARRKGLLRLIGRQICAEPLMLRCLKLLGIGQINAFALLAIIGDVRRFENPAKLVAYIGLNPGQRESGRGKHVKLGVGKHGRKDMRNLLIQGAHAVLRMGRETALGTWGWKIFARKGQRNIAVTAVARKLLVQVWHLLTGNAPVELEPGKSLATKLQKLAVTLGKKLRAELSLPANLAACVLHLQTQITQHAESNTA
ncbi:MAG: IS110 family transposase [Luteolibacter sp.]|uniref:IS110 family transposase n=1 Tax=Luteolibacter sp. TaxID=1962973 RepID=UPI003267C418